jgi:hypothetical protein
MMSNSDTWQDNSDGWVTAMNKSKDMKQLYQSYLKTIKHDQPLSYRAWLKQIGQKDHK